MTKKEKTLGVILLGVAVLAGGFQFGPGLVAAVFGAESLAEKQKKLNDLLDKNFKDAGALVSEYKELGGMAMGRDADSAKNHLDGAVKKLVDACKLTNPRYSPKQEVRIKRSDMLVIPYSLSAEGPLRAVVTFLARFYDEPYLWTIRAFSLAPGDNKGNDLVKMTADIETIVLPKLDLKIKDADGKPWDPLKDYPVAEMDSKKRQDPPMTADVLASAYGSIWAEQFLTPYKPPKPKPPPPTKPKPPRPKPVVKANPKPPPKPPPAAWAQTTVTGVFRVENVYEAVLYNKASKTREYSGVGDDCAGGKIVLVHPLGIIVRKNAKDYVYPLGTTLSGGEALTEAKYPEIHDALMKLAKR